MDIHEISELARILRENGNEVLNSKSKFSLSTTLLGMLNNSFAIIIEPRDLLNTTFQVALREKTNEIFRDLQFLHDFIQRTTSLKLTPNFIGSSCSEIVDISKFRNLKLFELRRVNCSMIMGLQTLRPRLQYLICNHSIHTLEEVLKTCGADFTDESEWRELKEAVFSHNKLKQIDSSLKLAPWLHTLDLSYNEIKDASPLSCLSNLKNLNLSFNRLEVVPSFTGQSCSRLQVLILHNNFIEDIRELLIFVNLCELDLKDNCLLEHESLAPLAYLAALQLLSVNGNPLSFHPQHRIRTAKFLHVNTATVRFLLDNQRLNKMERKHVGSLHPIHFGIDNSHTSSFCSNVSESTVIANERNRRVRKATITENDYSSDSCDASFMLPESLLTSGEHLETKFKIEQLREKYGDTWLHSQGGGSLVQDALGLEKTLPTSCSPYEHDFLLHANINIAQKESSDISSEQSANNTFATADSSISNNALSGGELPSDDEDIDESEENLYIATVKNNIEPMIIVLTNTHICECESTDAKEKTRWHLETLQSCELLADDCTEVRLTFDTVKKDRQERHYVLESNEATRLACVLKNILSNRSLEENNFIVYLCMKCSNKFVYKKKRGREIPALECPSCKSTVIIEDDEHKK